MTDGFRNFKSTVTGEVVYLPAHYADLFDTLEPTDEDVECTTCNLPDPSPEEPTQSPDTAVEPLGIVEPAEPAEATITEPARRSRKRSNSDDA